MTHAEWFAAESNARCENLEYTGLLDVWEPWTWADDASVDTVNDDGNNFTSVFFDGSMARWTSEKRRWAVQP